MDIVAHAEARLLQALDKWTARAAELKARRARPHWVYLAGLRGLLKIGMAEDPYDRVTALGSEARHAGFGERGAARLLYAVLCENWAQARRIEATVCGHFARLRFAGDEWFSHDPSIVHWWKRYVSAVSAVTEVLHP